MDEKKIDRRVLKTKKALRFGLTSLLQEKSLSSITVREISERAEVNRGTFYIHYKDIDDLVSQIKDEAIEEFIKVLNIKTDFEEGRDTPRDTFYNILSFFEENSDICIAFLSKNGDVDFIDRIEKALNNKFTSEWVGYFNLKDDVNVDYVFSYCLSGTVEVIGRWVSEENRMPKEKMTDFLFNIVPYGIKVFEK